jgi:hypothetical protein
VTSPCANHSSIYRGGYCNILSNRCTSRNKTAHVFFGLVEEAYMGWRYSELGVGLESIAFSNVATEWLRIAQVPY